MGRFLSAESWCRVLPVHEEPSVRFASPYSQDPTIRGCRLVTRMPASRHDPRQGTTLHQFAADSRPFVRPNPTSVRCGHSKLRREDVHRETMLLHLAVA